MNSNWSYSPETPNLGKIRWFLEPRDLEIWRMTLQNDRAPFVCYFKLCASFRSHWWIQTGVTVRKCPIWVKFDHFQSRVTLKYDGWPCKTTGHLFYATSSFVHHFVAIGEFKLELQSGNAQFGSNSTIFRAVWQNNRAPLLNQHQTLCIISSSYVNSNWSYGPETAKLGVDLCDLDLWPWPFAWTSLLSLVIITDNFMMIWWWEHSQKGVTDGQTDGQTDGRTHKTVSCGYFCP